MPPKFLFDLAEIDLNQVLFDQDAVRETNPQRGAFEQLNGIIWADPSKHRLLGFKDIREDEFWVPGHIPGRPLYPGVLMIEAGAQLASFYTKRFLKWDGFIGFGGVDNCKFRAQVTPGVRMYLLGEQKWHRHRRVCCRIQGIVDGQMCFEAEITGAQF